MFDVILDDENDEMDPEDQLRERDALYCMTNVALVVHTGHLLSRPNPQEDLASTIATASATLLFTGAHLARQTGYITRETEDKVVAIAARSFVASTAVLSFKHVFGR